MASADADQQAAVKQEERICEFCTKSLPAQKWCYQCAQPMCQECCQAHNELKLLKEHVVVPLDAVSEEDMRKFQIQEKCEKHRKKLKFFCLQCDLPACSTCAILVHDGHKKTELDDVLEEKKIEVQSWCQKVETALPAFRDRETSSRARLQKLDTTLEGKVQQVQNLFSDIVSKVRVREEEVLADLRAKIKGQRETLEEQHRRDRWAVESAEALAMQGRAVASLGLPLQLIGQPRKMEKEFKELQAPEEAAVEPLPGLMLNEGGVAAMLTYLESVGEVVEMPFLCPELKLVPSNNPRSSLHEDGCSLSNDARPVAEEDATPHQLNGSLTTAAAPDTTCYWQIRCLVTPRDRLNDGWLCEMGICDPESLWGSDTWHMSGSNSTSSTLVLAKEGRNAVFKPYIEAALLPDTPLAVWPRDAPLDCTVGFLLDRPRRRLHVIDVMEARSLLSTDVQMDRPLWPVLCVCPKGKVRADVRMELQSGARIGLSSNIVYLLKSLLDGTYWSALSQLDE